MVLYVHHMKPFHVAVPTIAVLGAVPVIALLGLLTAAFILPFAQAPALVAANPTAHSVELAPAAAPVSGAASLGVEVSTEATTTQATDDGLWLVTIEDNDAGWAILFGSSQWVSPECRNELTATGAEFEIVEWDVIASTTDTIEERSCADLADLWFAVPPSSWAASEEQSPPESAPVQQASEPAPARAPEAAGLLPVGLARGINFAGDFEVTPRSSWGRPIDAEWFALAAAQGFDHVRVPIRWSSYTSDAPAFTIDDAFFAEVDGLVALANLHGLGIVLDVHFFEELDEDPLGGREEFLAIWAQISERYAGEAESVIFELLNEPTGAFDGQPELWNQLAAEALTVVRQTNPTRTVIIGPVNYNHATRLPDLVLPSDPNLVVTIHTYDPADFTHQGAVWATPVPPVGQLWDPLERAVNFNWADRSWGVAYAPTASGIGVDYSGQYTAFAVAGSSGDSFDTLEIRADRAAELIVLCNYEDSGLQEISATLDADGSAQVDVSACGALSSLALQSRSGVPVSLEFTRLGLCNGRDCEELIVTQRGALEILIGDAAAWAAEQGVALYIGEFGALSVEGTPTDAASRYAWTSTIRETAESHGAGWAYFDMSGGFSAYDFDSGVWREEIVTALFD